MDQTRARRALEAVLITGLCGMRLSSGCARNHRAAQPAVWPFKRLPNLFMDLQAEDSREQRQ